MLCVDKPGNSRLSPALMLHCRDGQACHGCTGRGNAPTIRTRQEKILGGFPFLEIRRSFSIDLRECRNEQDRQDVCTVRVEPRRAR